jgi:hypothetical protein
MDVRRRRRGGGGGVGEGLASGPPAAAPRLGHAPLGSQHAPLYRCPLRLKPRLPKPSNHPQPPNSQPPGMFKRLADSFGYLSKKGYCAAGKCLKWPVLLGEFSAPHAGAPGDYAAAAGLVQFINSEPINLWFYWCWNDNSPE